MAGINAVEWEKLEKLKSYMGFTFGKLLDDITIF